MRNPKLITEYNYNFHLPYMIPDPKEAFPPCPHKVLEDLKSRTCAMPKEAFLPCPHKVLEDLKSSTCAMHKCKYNSEDKVTALW
jgi:hypothetical protein